MRLIDADALRKEIRELPNESTDYFYSDVIDREVVQALISEAPTVERPHGEWKEVCDFDGNHYKWECSVCGRLEEFEEDFCNCGADMRKEGDNK